MTEFDPTDVEGNARAEASDERARALWAEVEKSDQMRLLSTRWGRRIVWAILDRAAVMVSSFNPNALQMARIEGQKNEGYYWLDRIEQVAPDAYSLMIQERQDDRAAAESSRSNNQP